VRRVLYLHGFASSPKSSKATFFGARFAERGVPFEAPDLNEPSFRTLTVSRMLEQVAERIGPPAAGPITLIGSSLGGFTAVAAAERHPDRVDRLVLLAPALDFNGNRMRELGDRGLEDWRDTGELNVFHYAYGRVCPVGYELYADARRYAPMNASLSQPIQVFQGRRDESVDPDTVEQWSAARPNVELHMLDDDHQLTASLDYIWREMAPFLGLGVRS
jgi:pimeloyl-ACP methyl ester carboxylesterase